MDLRTGKTYRTKEEALAAGVPESDIVELRTERGTIRDLKFWTRSSSNQPRHQGKRELDRRKTVDTEQLIERYKAGASTEDICKEFGITRSRLYQILKKAGVPKERHQPEGNDQFLGVNLSESVKDALRAEASRRGVSMSALSSETLREMLISCGYPLEAEGVNCAHTGDCAEVLPHAPDPA